MKTGANSKSHLWDIENFNFTWAYSEIKRTNITIESYKSTNHLYSLGYSFSANAPPIEPFKNAKAFKSPYLKLIKDINFSYLPSNITFRGDVLRTFTRTQLRSSDVFSSYLPPGLLTFEKSFYFNRNYSVRYSPFKSFTMDYTANIVAIVDEPAGDINSTEIRPGLTKRDSLWKNIRKFGRTKTFDQNIRLGYRLPLDKFPLTDWISADVAYTANYQWQAAPLGLADDSLRFLGNTVQNSRERSVNGRFDLVKFYNKIKWLNEINNPKPKPKKKESPKPDPKAKQAVKKKEPPKKPAPKPKKLSKKEQKIKDLKDAQLKARADSVTKATGIDPRKTKDAKAAEKTKAETDTAKRKPPELKALKAVVRLLMSVRNVNFSVTSTENTILPGYTQTVDYLGINKSTNAPGWPFILGDQDPNIRVRAGKNGWLTTSPEISMPFSQSRTLLLSGRATVEPIKDFRVQIDVKRSETDIYSENYRTDTTIDDIKLGPDGKPLYFSQTPSRSGNYSVSFIAINTAFSKIDPNNQYRTPEYQKFEENRAVVQQRLINSGQIPGADTASLKQDAQTVLIPSFIAAYTGKDASSIALTAFPKIPLPNWRLDYAGLTKIPYLADKFSSVNLTHGYTCNYSVDQFTSTLTYGANDALLLTRDKEIIPNKISPEGIVVPVYAVNQTTIQERFSPLVGINIRTKSKITLKFDYNRDRTIVLNTPNASVTEQRTKDYTFGAGYQKSGLKLPFKVQGVQVVLKNEVTFRCDISYRNIANMQRFFSQANTFVAGSTRELQIRPTINYVVNQRFNIQIYYSRVVTNPYTSQSFPTKTTKFGIQMRFNLN